VHVPHTWLALLLLLILLPPLLLVLLLLLCPTPRPHHMCKSFILSVASPLGMTEPAANQLS
jgi:hypothetical protein